MCPWVGPSSMPLLLSFKFSTFPTPWEWTLIFAIHKHSGPCDSNNYQLISVIFCHFEIIWHRHLRRGALINRVWGAAERPPKWFPISPVNRQSTGPRFTVKVGFTWQSRVWHEGHPEKTIHVGFSSFLLSRTTSYLSKQTISVWEDRTLSQLFPITAGVPRNALPEPNRFLLLINSLLFTTFDPIHYFWWCHSLLFSFLSQSPPCKHKNLWPLCRYCSAKPQP